MPIAFRGSIRLLMIHNPSIPMHNSSATDSNTVIKTLVFTHLPQQNHSDYLTFGNLNFDVNPYRGIG
jgi:hypothetical protein